MYEIRETDLHIIFNLMHPSYVIPLACQLGGHPVLGAPLAYSVVRETTRDYLRFIRWRDNIKVADMGLALVLRAMGWVPANHKHVTPIEKNTWRETAAMFWPYGDGTIPGYVQIEVPEGQTQEEVDLKLLVAISKMLYEKPELNKAFLQGEVFQRQSPEIMVHREIRGDMRSVVFDASQKDEKWVKTKLFRALRSYAKEKRTTNRLTKLAPKLLQAWAETGFITSPAGAMVSLVGGSGVEMGQSALVPSNGIPLAITVGRLTDNKVWVGVNADHRVLDGSHLGTIYQYLKGVMND